MSKQTVMPLTFRALALLGVLGLVAATALVACGGSAAPTQAPPAATSPAVTAPGIDAANLLETRCSGCHSTDRAKTAQKTEVQWEQTVDSMISKGAQLTDAEKAALVGYLTKNYGK